MRLHKVSCVCLLVLCISQLANATGGAVNLSLDRVFKDYKVQTILIGEVRGFERSQVSGAKPQDGTNPKENRFHQYSYLQIEFRVIPQEVLRGSAKIGKPMNLKFREHDFSGSVTLKADGTTEDGLTALGHISTGSGNERNNHFCELGKKCVFIIGRAEGEKKARLLRVEHADKTTLQKLNTLLKKKNP